MQSGYDVSGTYKYGEVRLSATGQEPYASTQSANQWFNPAGFTLPAPGTFGVQVWARDAGSNAPYDGWRNSQPYTALRPPALTVTSIAADRLAPVSAGTPVTWVQEEPENMGAWRYLRARFGATLLGRHPFFVASRPESPTPASGAASSHKMEQERLLASAFNSPRKLG